MIQFKKPEHRVWTQKAWQEALGQAKNTAKRWADIQAEKEKLVAEGKLRKVVVIDGKTIRYHYEKV